MRIVTFMAVSAFLGILQSSAMGVLGKTLLWGRVAKTMEILHVVDQDGMPVPDAIIFGGFRTGTGLDDYIAVNGRTDSSGKFVAKGRCVDFLRCQVKKEGFYTTEYRLVYTDPKTGTMVKNGKWQPYGTIRTIVLKKQQSSQNLCVFSDTLLQCAIPVFGKWIGFDFEKCDWTSPYGQGTFTDVLLKFSASRRTYNNLKYKMEVCFTNNLYAGAYRLKKDKWSSFVTEYRADTNQTYQAMFSFFTECVPGKQLNENYLYDDDYLVFRTRTRINDEGDLIGAHYGTILGRWLSNDKVMILSDGCFNLRENDLNLEDGRTLRDALKILRRNPYPGNTENK